MRELVAEQVCTTPMVHSMCDSYNHDAIDEVLVIGGIGRPKFMLMFAYVGLGRYLSLVGLRCYSGPAYSTLMLFSRGLNRVR